MAARTSRTRWITLAALALLAAPACTTKKSEAPALSGPSELGLSLAIAATPDVLTMDGVSRSTITITARNGDGQPARDIGLRVETRVGPVLMDLGRLSSKTVVTGSDGRATVTYTAPAGAPEGNSQDDEILLTVRAIPASTNYANAVERTVDIRLVPQGVILPPACVPVASFSFSPSAPTEGQTVQFDASASTDGQPGASCVATGLSYAWSFGDGTSGSGVQVSHTYRTAGSYSVTLTVTNGRGNTASVSKFVEVGVSANPTADFTFSPTAPEVLQSVFFNASASKAAPGRTLVSYDWTFGDGSFGTGVTVTHRFGTPGTWTVTLTVTDDVGKTGTASKSITLGADLEPTADFVYSPTDPTVGQLVHFDARPSTPTPGRTLTRWEWNFGDGATAEGERVSHAFAAARAYTVVLTVTDNTGARKTVSKTVTVK
jgi:PKD repeat protein